MKTVNFADLIKESYVGRVLITSEYHRDKEVIYDAYDNHVIDFTPYGKKIVDASVGMNFSREDAGLLLWVEGYDNPFFFYENCDLTLD